MDSNNLKKASFAYEYGDTSLDYDSINTYGAISEKYSFYKIIGIATFVIFVLAVLGGVKTKTEEDKFKKKEKSNLSTILFIIAGVLLIISFSCLGYYFYAFSVLYLGEYRDYYSDLPEDGINRLRNFT